MSGDSAPTGNTTIRTDEVLRRAVDALGSGALGEAYTLARSVAEAAPQLDDAWRVMAAATRRQGRLADAAQTLREGISYNPNSPALFTDLGAMLRDIGRFEDAETALTHALSVRPDYSDAALHLGNMLAAAGRLHEAEYVFRKAARSSPNDPRLQLQIGRLMLQIGNLAMAKQIFEKTVALSREILSGKGDAPQDASIYIEAASHLGALLLATGERLKALNYFFDAVQLGGTETVRQQFAECVSPIAFAEAQPLLKPLLVRALSEAWIAPEELMSQGADQLILDPEFAAAAERIVTLPQDADAPLASSDVQKVARDSLLRALLTSAIIADPALERLLTAMRRLLLQASIAPRATAGSGDLLAFAAALATQCHLTDYAYASSPEEEECVGRLAARIADAAGSGEPIAAWDVAVFASYRPLSGLDDAMALARRNWEPAIDALFQRQVREPATEATLRETVSAITPISDERSMAVRSRYEATPLPRWVLSPVRTQRATLGAWLGDLFSHLPAAEMRYFDPTASLAVLDAGCGTGRGTVGVATRFANAQILAVDLSGASLASARRRTEEIGLKNISYAQADILQLGGLGRQFDFVECTGVLHHLSDPAAAWQVLAGLTKPGGYMLMGLHSRLGRRHLEAVRAFATERSYGTGVAELRRFRADIRALPSDHPVRSALDADEMFYNLGMLGDLFSGMSDHAFTIPEIGALLEQTGLEFCGFMTDAESLVGFRERFGPQTDLRSLGHWETFENVYPGTFSAMYRFLVRKPG